MRSCESRVLLGIGRIVQFASPETGRLDVVLGCYCGTEVRADVTSPDHPAAVPAARVAFATSLVSAAS